MKRFVLFALAATSVVSFSVNADVWSRLKTTPATQYDVGRIYLDMAAIELTKELHGKKVRNSHYKVKKIDSITDGGKLGLRFSYEANGKYISKSDCNIFLNASKNTFPFSHIVDDVWPDVSEISKKEIVDGFVLEADLTNKNTGSVLVECR